jgi:hypothetical protein
MGTSLFNTTPANTYPALIKVGNNTSIDGTLKVLSDGAGNDLPIQVSSTVTNFTGNVGVDVANPAYALDVNGVINARFAFNQTNANANQFSGIINQGGASQSVNGINCIRLNSQLSAMIGAAQAPTSTLQLKGAGSTSATTSLLVQNSSSATSLEVKDDRTAQIYNTLTLVGTLGYIADSTDLTDCPIDTTPTCGDLIVTIKNNLVTYEIEVPIENTNNTTITKLKVINGAEEQIISKVSGVFKQYYQGSFSLPDSGSSIVTIQYLDVNDAFIKSCTQTN